MGDGRPVRQTCDKTALTCRLFAPGTAGGGRRYVLRSIFACMPAESVAVRVVGQRFARESRSVNNGRRHQQKREQYGCRSFHNNRVDAVLYFLRMSRNEITSILSPPKVVR
jgi:hypothetical protein